MQVSAEARGMVGFPELSYRCFLSCLDMVAGDFQAVCALTAEPPLSLPLFKGREVYYVQFQSLIWGWRYRVAWLMVPQWHLCILFAVIGDYPTLLGPRVCPSPG